MAIEKTLNTRLKLRYDSHDNWIANDPVLLAGEVALSTVAVKQDGTVNYVPSVLVKVGDGTHKYSELDFAYAKAADVVSAAKSEVALTEFINNVISNSGLATDNAMTSLSNRVSTAEGEIDTLQSEMDAVEKQAADNATAIATLENLVGTDKNVATQISEAIAALNLSTTYEAKGEAASALTDAKSYADGLNTAMDTRVEAVEATSHAHANKAELDKIVEGDKTKWDAMEQNAKDYVDGLDEAMDTRVQALEAKFGEGEGNVESQIAAAVADETAAREAADTALDNRVKAIENDYLVEADKTELQGAIDALEGIVGDGNVSDRINSAVTTEKERAEGVESGLDNRLKAVEEDYLKASDKTELQNQINTIMNNPDTEGVINSINEFTQYIADHGEIAEGFRTDIDANAAAIDAIENDYLKSADKTELSNAIAAEKTRAEGVEGGLDTRLAAVEAAVGETGSVATAIDEAVTEAKGYADAEIKELAEGAVATNASDIAALEDLVGDKKVSEQISSVTDPISARVTTLEGKSHEHANKTVLDGISADKVTAWDAKVDDVTAAADSGLKATRTGNSIAIEVDDSITWIFDCGDSTNV